MGKVTTNKQNIVATIVALLSLFLLASPSLANITDTMDVSLEKAEAMRISDLNDFFFAHNESLAGTERIKSDDVCIYSSSGQYFVTASGLHTTANGRNFRVFDGAGNYIRYNLFWSDQTTGGNGSFTRLYVNERRGIYSNADSTDQTCAGGTNSRIQVRIRNNQFRAAVNGTYTDVVTLLFEAQ